MKRCDPIAVSGIDRRTSLDEQLDDTGSLGTLRAPKIGDAMKRRLPETIGRIDVRSAIEEIGKTISALSDWAACKSSGVPSSSTSSTFATVATAGRSPRYTDVTTEMAAPALRRSSTISCAPRAAA
jgi:hypothetical protein